MKIIVAYDDSSAAKLALETAKIHASAFQAQILIVTSMDGSAGESKDHVKKAEKTLEKIKTDFESLKISCETEQAIGLINVATADRTLLIIEHDMNVIFSLADTISVLHHGTILASGAPESIRNDQRVKDAYLGED